MAQQVGVTELGVIGKPITQQLGVPLYLGVQASLIADAGIATGHDNTAF